VCLWGGGGGFSNLWIFLRKCCSVHYSDFVLNCCKTRPELVWKLSISYQRPHVFVTFHMPVGYGLSMFLFNVLARPPPVVLSSTTTLLKQKLHVSSRSISIRHLRPWSKWRYCPYCVTSLYVRHVIIGCGKLMGKVVDRSLTAYVSYNISRKAVSCLKMNKHKHAPRRYSGAILSLSLLIGRHLG
jgi:hypothetical protein